MNSDGSGRHSLGAWLLERLSGWVADEEPAFSPSGEKIAFVSYPGNDNAEIYLMNADGSGRTRLMGLPGNDHSPPTWSPDDDRIAFTSDGKDETGDIYVMNSDGSGLSRLTYHPAEDAFPAWRP